MAVLRRSLRVVLVSAVAVLFLPVPATAAQRATGVDSDEVVRYADPNPDASQITLHGRRIGPDSCEFSLEGTGAGARESQGAVRYDEIEYDPANCVSVIDVSSADSGSADTQYGESIGGASALAGPTTASSDTGAASLLCENPYKDTSRTYTAAACIHSWFEDPPRIHVNDLTNYVQWNPSGGCATAGASHASYYIKYLTSTGWSVNSNKFSPSFSCSGVVSHNETVFQNTAFCAGVFPVLTGYNQKITGRGNGTYSWSVTWAKNGLCSGLLSFHTEQRP